MADLPYIRAVYVAPWRKGSLAKPGMVRCRVDDDGVCLLPFSLKRDSAVSIKKIGNPSHLPSSVEPNLIYRFVPFNGRSLKAKTFHNPLAEGDACVLRADQGYVRIACNLGDTKRAVTINDASPKMTGQALGQLRRRGDKTFLLNHSQGSKAFRHFSRSERDGCGGRPIFISICFDIVLAFDRFSKCMKMHAISFMQAYADFVFAYRAIGKNEAEPIGFFFRVYLIKKRMINLFRPCRFDAGPQESASFAKTFDYSGAGHTEGNSKDDGTFTLSVSRDDFNNVSLAQLFPRCHLSHLPSFLHTLGTLDIFTDRLRTHITRRADIVGRGPKVAAPQPLLQLREPDEQLARRGSLQNLDRIGHRLRRRNGHKQVDVIGLDFLGQHWPPLFLANRVDHLRQRRRHIPGQNIMPILRTPHHMVSRLENAIAVMQHFWHNHMVQENCAARNLAFLPRLKPGVSSEVIL